MPKVSVIIPAYNSARFLIKTIASVLDQTMRDFEVIVIDDGSTDNTQETVQGVADHRVRILIQQNQGCAAALNSGLKAATGEYIALLDADGTYLPDKLLVQSRFLDEHPEVGMVSSGWYYVDEKGTLISEARPWETVNNLDTRTWLFSCPVIVNGQLVRRDWIDKLGGFDASLRSSEDFDLWLRLAHAGCRMEWLPEIVCTYRVHDSDIARNARLKRDTYIAMLDKFFAAPDVTAEELSLKNQAYAHHYLEGAAREYAAGQLKEAAEDIDRGIHKHPSVLTNNGDQIVEMIVAFATSPFTHNPNQFIHTFFKHLPASASVVRGRLREVESKVAMFLLYEAYRRENWIVIPRLAFIAAWHNPEWLLNWGFYSIFLRSIFHTIFEFGHPKTNPYLKGAIR